MKETNMKKTLIELFVAFAVIALQGLLTMIFWNWLMPVIFGLTTLTYWQSVGIVLLGRGIFRPTMKLKDFED